MKYASILAAIALAGCAVANKTYGPDGREAYSINCSGSALTWGACEEKAGGICGESGYTVISRSGDQGAIASAGTGGLFATSVINRTMLVACGAPL